MTFFKFDQHIMTQQDLEIPFGVQEAWQVVWSERKQRETSLDTWETIINAEEVHATCKNEAEANELIKEQSFIPAFGHALGRRKSQNPPGTVFLAIRTFVPIYQNGDIIESGRRKPFNRSRAGLERDRKQSEDQQKLKILETVKGTLTPEQFGQLEKFLQ